VLVLSLLLTASVRGRRLVESDRDSVLYLHTDYPLYKLINTYLQFHLPLGYNCVSVIRFSYNHQFTLKVMIESKLRLSFFLFMFLQVSDIRSRCHQSLLPVTESTVSTATATTTSRISRIFAKYLQFKKWNSESRWSARLWFQRLIRPNILSVF